MRKINFSKVIVFFIFATMSSEILAITVRSACEKVIRECGTDVTEVKNVGTRKADSGKGRAVGECVGGVNNGKIKTSGKFNCRGGSCTMTQNNSCRNYNKQMACLELRKLLSYSIIQYINKIQLNEGKLIGKFKYNSSSMNSNPQDQEVKTVSLKGTYFYNLSSFDCNNDCSVCN